MLIVYFILAVLLSVLTLFTAYLVGLAAVYLLYRPGNKRPAGESANRFCIVVPAHNEAQGIGRTLSSLKSLDYPQRLFDVVAVADNCTDGTAAVVRSAGCACLERSDRELKGKGYALKFAFEKLLPEGYDAFIVVDADSILSADFLRSMDNHLLSGEKVIQGCYGLSNPDASALTYFFQIGNVLENGFFYEAKSRLGLPVNLRGNGMCFAREVLERFPWDSFSITEDTEYGLRLLSNGLSISFAPEAIVLARQPETIEQANVQRVRWASGNAGVTKSLGLKLIMKGILKGDLKLADAGLSLFVLSKPFLLLLALLFVAASYAAYAIRPETGIYFLAWALSLLFAQAAYLFAGILYERIDLRRAKYLLLSPFLMIWFFAVTVLGLAGYRADTWARTTRT